MKVLDVQNLNVQYHTEKGNFDAVSGLSLSMEEGDITGLVGRSGCGKSTAVRAIMGISAENAEVEYENLSLDGQIPVPGHNIAMIFQDSQNCLNPSVKIGKQIAETVKNQRKCTKKEAKKRALELLDLVGIRNPALRMKQYPFELSGGMRQRVVIAIAISCDPDILICDEPTTALDVTIQAKILELIQEMQRKRNISVIYITHDLGVVAKVADYVAVMYAGKIVEKGTAYELYFEPRHPYTWGLLLAMPDLNTTDDRLYAIPGTPPNLLKKIVGDAFAPRNAFALNIDFEEEPPVYQISRTHEVSSWLEHPDAPKVKLPEALLKRIARMTGMANQKGGGV